MMAQGLNNPECVWEKDTAKTMTKYNVTNKQPKGSINTKPKLQLKSIYLAQKLKITFYMEGKEDWQPGKRAHT